MAATSEYRLPQEWQNNIAFKPVSFDLMDDLLIFCICYPPLVLIYYAMGGGISAYFRPLILFAVFIALTLFRRFTKKVWAFAALTLAVVLAVLAVPASQTIRIFETAVAVVAAVCSANLLYKDVKRKEIDYDNPQARSAGRFKEAHLPYLGLVVILISYLFALGIKLTPAIGICFASIVILMAVYGIYDHTSGICALKEWEKTEQNESSKKFTVLFSVLLAAGIGFLSFIVYEIVYATGLNGVDNAIVNYFANLKEASGTSAAENYQSASSQASINLSQFSNTRANSGIIIQVIWVILKTILLTALCAAALFLITAFFRWIVKTIKEFRRDINVETQSVFSADDVKKNITKRLQKLPFFFGVFEGYAGNVKIRKLYYKSVRRSIPAVKIAGSDTPAEIGEKLKDNGPADIKGMTGLYEKARYSGKECTADDVKAAKALSNGKNHK